MSPARGYRRDEARNCDVQIAIGDGLSVAAVAEQVPHLLPLLFAGVKARGWTAGQAFAIRHCRVGILNEIGELLETTGSRAIDWRAPGPGDRDEPFSLHGVSSDDGTHRRGPKLDLEYSRARRWNG